MKRIILLIFMLMTVGCTAKYDLVIQGDVVTEELQLSSELSDIGNKEYLYGEYLNEYPIFNDEEFLYYAPTQKIEGVEYYDKNILETEYGYNVTYKSKMDFSQYENSRLLNNAFNNIKIDDNYLEGYYYIMAQDLKLFEYDNNITNLELNINLGTYEIVDSNADSHIGNIYTWNFSKNDNNSNDRVIIKFKEKREIEEEIPNKSENNNKDEKKEVSTSDILLVVGLFGGFLVVLVLLIILTRKNNK